MKPHGKQGKTQDEERTFALAFLQFRHALRVTESGTRRRLEALLLLSGFSLSPERMLRIGSEPVDSEGLLVEAELSPKDGRILRKDMVELFMP